MRGAAEILIEHTVNRESCHTSPGAIIILTSQQELGLNYLIEASTQMVDGLFDEIEDQHCCYRWLVARH